MKRTIAIVDNPRIELALRELERMVATTVNSTTAETLDTVVVTSANYNMASTDDAVYVDTDTGTKTVYLTSSPTKGQIVKVGNRGSNTLTVNGMGRNINGDTTLIIAYEHSTAQLQYTGTEWAVI
jgi:hypothetical protein